MVVPMKICFLVGTLARGGAERQLLFMLRALKNARFVCRVLCLTEGECYEAEIKALDIPIECVGKSRNRYIRLLRIIGNLNKQRADVVQSSHFYTNIYAGLAGKCLRIPSVGAIRSDLDSEIKAHGFLGKLQVSMPRFLIVNSSASHERAIKRGISKQNISFVRNVVEIGTVNSFKSLNRHKMVKFLWVGRLDADKKPENFIRLASVMNKLFPTQPMMFSIAGDGGRRDELIKLANQYGLIPDKLEFLGICSNMNEIYSQADVLVSTSAREGTSNVILEAMAHSLPVIATNVGGTADILSEKCGILVRPENEFELVSAAAELLQYPVKRLHFGNEGKKYVEHNHSLERLETELQTIYEQLILTKRKGKFFNPNYSTDDQSTNISRN
jgi:L-malate glycosyltransferase